LANVDFGHITQLPVTEDRSALWDQHDGWKKTLKPLKIGNLTIGFPIVQAALSGYSDWPMRLLARRFGASYTLCEVMLDKFLVEMKDRKRTSHFLHLSEEDHLVAGQLMGAEPIQFSQGAKKLVEAGFDVIDINFGCPVKKVLGRCRGGFHLSQPEVALEVIRRTRDVVPDDIPVTVKMRRGIDDSQESRDKFFKILEEGFEIGIAGVTVHGRTVEQRYVGPSRWSFLKEVKEFAGDRIVLGSGDLFFAEDCLRMIQESGVEGFTVARGAIGNPWIFTQARAISSGLPNTGPPSFFQQAEVIREHFRLAEMMYGEKRVGAIMRKFGIKYSMHHPDSEEVRKAFATARTIQQWNDVLEKYYSQDLPGVVPDGNWHKAQGS